MAPKTKDKPKPSPPSQSPPLIPLEDLFASLDRHLQRSEYDQAVKIADQVLAIAPGDEDGVRCKVVALIKADYLDRALSAIQTYEGLPIDLGFYKAYCLYRQNKLNEALESLKGQERNSAVLQLESQILYRLGKMDDCMETYEKLQKFKIDLEVKTNIIAALIMAGRASEVQGMMDALKVKATSCFEMAYNSACSLIEKGKYADAEQQLLSARRIGQEMLMDGDYADDEIENELAPISVQLAYVRQRLGHPQEAMEAYREIINRNLADASSLAVATNNLIALKGSKEVSDGLRKLDRLIEKGVGAQRFQLAHGLDFKLSSRQKESIYSNRLLLLLHANRMDQAQELAAALPDMFPNSVMPVLLQAAVLVRGNKSGKAVEILGQYAEKFPERSDPVLLARAQVAAAANHPQIAAECLSKIPNIQHMPAVAATLVSLKERYGDVNGAMAVLESAIEWWKNAMEEEHKKLNILIYNTASFKLKHGHEKEASGLFEELYKSCGGAEALAGLVTTAAGFDIAKAETYEKMLKQLPGLEKVDVESLEKTSGAKHVEGGGHSGNAEVYEEGKGKGQGKAKKKRKRKPKYPKGFDPANPGPPPDPERWLPKRERSSYRPKRKDKRVAQVRGSQGTVVREKHEVGNNASNTGNSSNTASNLKSNPATTSSTSSKGVVMNATSEQPKASSSKSRKKKLRS